MARPSIVEMYNSGITGGQIAEITGMPVSSVYSRLRAYGVQMRKRGQRAGMGDHIDRAEVEKTRLLYLEGYSSTEVAKMLGITHDTVCYRLELAGVPRRSRGESCRLVFERRRNG